MATIRPLLRSAIQPLARGLVWAYGIAGYVMDSLVLGLGELGFATILDDSPNRNTAYLYTGRGIYTEGTIDKGINVDLGAITEEVTIKVWVKPGFVSAWISGSDDDFVWEDLTPNVWQEVEMTVENYIFGVFSLGYGNYNGYCTAAWSDARIFIAGVLTHRWLLDESPAADLDGAPAFDCVGGLHGEHINCSSVTGEGIDPDVVAFSAYPDGYWFTRTVGDDVEYAHDASLSFGDGVTDSPFCGEAIVCITEVDGVKATPIFSKCVHTGPAENEYNFSVNADGKIYLGLYDLNQNTGKTCSKRAAFVMEAGVIYRVGFTYDGSGHSDGITLYTKSVDVDTPFTDDDILLDIDTVTDSIAYTAMGPKNYPFTIGSFVRQSSTWRSFWDGMISNVALRASDDFSGVNILDSLTPTINGDVGNIGQMRQTIPQTANRNFNKGGIFDTFEPEWTTESGTEGFSSWIRASTTPAVAANGGITIWNDAGVTNNYYASASINTVSDTIIHHVTFDVTNNAAGSRTFSMNDASSTANWTATIPNSSVGAGATRSFELTYLVNGATANTRMAPRMAGALSDGESFTISNFKLTKSHPDGTLIPEGTITGEDIFGNAIAKPRANDSVVNLASASESVVIYNHDSLDLVNDFTFEAWVDVYGEVPATWSVVNKGANFEFVKKASGEAQADNAFVDFRPATGHALSSFAITEGLICWQVVQSAATGTQVYLDTVQLRDIPAAVGDIAVNTDPITILGNDDLQAQISHMKLYNAPLDEDQRLQNYNYVALTDDDPETLPITLT